MTNESEQVEAGESIMIALSVVLKPGAGTQLTEHGLNYDMVVDRVKVLANGTEIAPTARVQLYAGGVLFADLHARGTMDGDGQRLATPGMITMFDLLRVRGDLPADAEVLLSGIGAAPVDPSTHHDWSGPGLRPTK